MMARMAHETVLTLRALRPDDQTAFRSAVLAFRATDPGWDFAFLYDDGNDFAEYVNRVNGWAQGHGLPARFVPNTYLIALAGGELVGRVSIRHRLNDFLERVGGHIGYGVVPGQQRRGYGRTILQQTLPIARGIGLDRVLLTCDDDNEASRKIIEANGGVLENIVTAPDLRCPKRRYWIDLK
jgi:predicted acetyltransferase